QVLEDIIILFDKHAQLMKDRTATEELAQNSDSELAELARDELKSIDEELDANEAALNEALTPKDPNDERNVVIEIRAAAGGDEASLFAADLYRMYIRWTE